MIGGDESRKIVGEAVDALCAVFRLAHEGKFWAIAPVLRHAERLVICAEITLVLEVVRSLEGS